MKMDEYFTVCEYPAKTASFLDRHMLLSLASTTHAPPPLPQGKPQEALTLARAHSRAPHFARSMEWLLFTTLEMDAERFMQAMAKQCVCEECALVHQCNIKWLGVVVCDCCL